MELLFVRVVFLLLQFNTNIIYDMIF